MFRVVINDLLSRQLDGKTYWTYFAYGRFSPHTFFFSVSVKSFFLFCRTQFNINENISLKPRSGNRFRQFMCWPSQCIKVYNTCYAYDLLRILSKKIILWLLRKEYYRRIGPILRYFGPTCGSYYHLGIILKWALM